MIGEWRYTITALRKHIESAKKNSHSSVDFDSLNRTLDQIENDFDIKDKYLLLEKINYPTKEYDKSLDHYIKVVKELNQLHRQYTQLIITAGYASFFGIWSIAKPYLNQPTIKWSLIWLGISTMSFILLEVFKIAIHGFELDFKNKTLLKAKFEDKLEKKLEISRHANRYEDCVELWLSRVWVVSYPISVITGFSAIALIGYGLFKSL